MSTLTYFKTKVAQAPSTHKHTNLVFHGRDWCWWKSERAVKESMHWQHGVMCCIMTHQTANPPPTFSTTACRGGHQLPLNVVTLRSPRLLAVFSFLPSSTTSHTRCLQAMHPLSFTASPDPLQHQASTTSKVTKQTVLFSVKRHEQYFFWIPFQACPFYSY